MAITYQNPAQSFTGNSLQQTDNKSISSVASKSPYSPGTPPVMTPNIPMSTVPPMSLNNTNVPPAIITPSKAEGHVANIQNRVNDLSQGMDGQAQANKQFKALQDQYAANQAKEAQDQAMKQQEIDNKTNLAKNLQETPAEPVLSPEQQQQKDLQTKQQAVLDELTTTIASRKTDLEKLSNTTFALTPDQQADINNLHTQFDQLLTDQQEANKAYQGKVQQAGFMNGSAEFSLNQAGLLKQATDQGLRQVANIESQAAAKIADLKKTFETSFNEDLDKKYQRINTLYDGLEKDLNSKSDIIKTMSQNVKDLIEQTKQKQQAQAEAVKSLATLAASKLTGDSAKDLAMLQGMVKANPQLGSVEALYSAALEQQQTQSEKNKPFEIGETTDINGNKMKVYGQLNLKTGKIEQVNMTGGNTLSGGTTTPEKAIGTTGTPVIDTSSLGYTTKIVEGSGGMTQASIDKAALQYAMTGTMPSVGLGSTGGAGQKRNAIQARAAELDASGQISSNKAKLTALTTSLGQQTTYLNTMERSINTVDDNLKILQGLAGKVNKSDKPIVNEITNKANSKYFGSGDLAAYKSALQTVRTEYANILARGGQVSDSVRAEAAQLIPDNINKSQLNQVLDVLKTEGQNVKNSAQKQVDDVSNNINNIIGGGNLYKQSGQYKTLDDYVKTNPNQLNTIDKIGKDHPDWSDQKILDLLKASGAIGFNNDLSKSQNGSQIEKIASAIKQVESGGNYNARGASGEHGAYQFMPSTWRGWAGQYLNDPSAPMTPENQDKVAQAKIADLAQQGYGPKEIALIWNGGQPIEKKGINTKGVNYDSGAYANKVLKALSNLT